MRTSMFHSSASRRHARSAAYLVMPYIVCGHRAIGLFVQRMVDTHAGRAVQRAGARVDEALDAMAARRFQHADGAEQIHFRDASPARARRAPGRR